MGRYIRIICPIMTVRDAIMYVVPRSVRASLIGVFTAAAVAGTFALSPLPNVEIITFCAFVAGFLFGSRVGGMVGALSMFLFSAISPYGSGLGYPFLLLTQVVGMSIAGLVGGSLRKVLRNLKSTSPWSMYVFGVSGIAVTLLYDAITTLGFMYPMIPFSEFPSVFAAGIPFTVVHVASNAVLLGVVAPFVARSIRSMLGEVEVESHIAEKRLHEVEGEDAAETRHV
ncbi:MAG: ECF transporter S component [Candidatus Jordarchaeales archaeon]